MIRKWFASVALWAGLAASFGAAAAPEDAGPATPLEAAVEESPSPEADAAPGDDPEAEVRPTWYAQALAQGPGGLNVTQFWSKGRLMRAETTISGHKIVTLVNSEWYYAYDATKGLGIRVRRTPEAIAQDVAYRRPFGNEAVNLIRQGAEKVREEEFRGREAEVYQLTDRLGRRVVWVTKDALNIPLRVEMFNRATGVTQFTDFTDWLTGLALADSYFEVDPAVEIESYEFDEYLRFTGKLGSVGPVPVLYKDLLTGR